VTIASEHPPEADDDARYMRAAISLGERELGRTWPNPAVGALVVKDGVIVGRGWTKQGGRPHAERVALAEAGEAARGATLYVSLEPCSHHGRTPPCADAIVEAGISRVVSAIEDPNPLVGGQGYARLRAAGVDVREDVLREEARRSHAGHLSVIAKKRPYVTLKMAVSANGKVALAGGKTVPVTGEETRGMVHMMRARSDAIAVGIGTVLADDPLLTCRLPGMEDRSPLRVVFDTRLRVPLDSQLVQTARQVPVCIVTGAESCPEAEGMLAPLGVEVVRAPVAEGGHLDLAVALRLLGSRGITRLMVEGGPLLAGALLKEGLVDEAVIFQSPVALPDDGLDAFSEPHGDVLEANGLELRATHNAGADRIFVYERG